MATTAKFDRIADYYDETRGGLERGERFASVLTPLLAPGRCLEIGVGTGAVAAHVRRGDRTVVGIDLSAGMLRHTTGRVSAAVRGLAEQLPFADASFGSVYAVWVLHMTDLDLLLAEVARVLRPGGRLLSVPAANPPVDGDRISEITWAMHSALCGPQLAPDSPQELARRAAPLGLRLTDVAQVRQEYKVIPAEVADNIERRGFSNLPGVDAAQWEEVVKPAIAELRALPGQHSPYARTTAHQVAILEKHNG
jgi:ubiquinone/menaquinone biosynthesis C-methylase UbiE